MARWSWSGVTWKGLTARALGPEKKGLILSGGGARASFHIGALRYLYDYADLAPTTFVGTSAGAIVATLLAQHGEPEQQRSTLDEFAELWFAMRDSAQMFTERPWFRQLLDRAPELRGLLDADVSPARSWWHRRPEDPAPPILPQPPGAELDLDEPLDEAGWTPSLVLRLVGALPSLRRAGNDLPQIARGFGHARSMYRAGPVMREIMELFDPRLVAQSGNTLRIATVQLDDGELYFVTETGEFVDRNNEPVDFAAQPLTLAVRASCTIPGVLIPVEMAGYEWVDGGIRENLPVEMGLGRLQITDSWVVNVQPRTLPVETANDLISIMMRSATILGNETLRDEVAYAHTAGARVVQPEIDVHDTAQVVPGLIRLNSDYGWIRAREVHTGAREEEIDRHRRLIQARLDAFHLEQELLGLVVEVPLGQAIAEPHPYGGPDDPRHGELALLKYRIMELVSAGERTEYPPGAGEWGRGWEYHLTDAPEPWWRTGR